MLKLLLLLLSIFSIAQAFPKLTPKVDLPATSNEAYVSNYCTRSATISFGYLRSVLLQIYRTRLHQQTLNAKKRDFIVLVCEATPESERETMRSLGAIVFQEKNLWITKDDPGFFVDGMAKFHFWRLLQYERLLFLDADLYLSDEVKYIWDEPASQLIKVKDHPLNITSYVMASVVDWCNRRPWPCEFSWIGDDYLNAGMYLFNPSIEILTYLSEKFENVTTPLMFQDQDMLNIVFNRSGPLPWTTLDERYNKRVDDEIPVEDAAIIHGKLWKNETTIFTQRWADDYRKLRTHRTL